MVNDSSSRALQSNLDTLEKLLQRAETVDGLTSSDVLQLSDEYQRCCQYYGFIQSIAPGSGLARRAVSAIQRGRIVLYKNVDSTAGREKLLKRLPKSFRNCLPYIVLSLSVGILSAAFAALLVFVRPALVWTLLPEKTIEALKEGHLWTESLEGFGMLASTGILQNNITVTLTAFALGITAGIGTIAILIFNGFHLGSTFAAVHEFHMADELFEFICAHGPLELSIIFVSGGAGLAIGDAILHPGMLTRRESLRRRAEIAFDLVVIGAVGLVFAGFIEGLVSPSPNIPKVAKVTLGLTAGGIYWNTLITGRFFPRFGFNREMKSTGIPGS